jgi:hypothetical protein
MSLVAAKHQMIEQYARNHRAAAAKRPAQNPQTAVGAADESRRAIMTTTRKKTAKFLGFEVTEPLAMGFSKGKRGLDESEDHLSPVLRFAIRPLRFPARQQIWLVPKDEKRDETKRIEFDPETWRRLTPEIEGQLIFVTRGLAVIEEASDAPTATIGTLSHGPAYKSADYGHAEFYYIEINLNERDFNQIRDIFLSGKSPSGISIWTPDVEYGIAPDGSDIIWEIWETKHSTFAKIVGFDLGFSMDIPRVSVGLKKTENEEESEREETEKVKSAILHSREDIQLLCYQQAALNTSFGGLRKQINILISVAVVIAIIVAFHFKF